MLKEEKRERRKYRRQSFYNLLLAMILLFVLPVLGYATFKNLEVIRNTDTGEGTTLETTPASAVSAGSYTIGNNPTETTHACFEELAQAVEAKDRKAIAEAVVKNFVAEYFTWTNKDGNYDIGGMQYIYSDLQGDFEKYTRDHFYSRLHLWIEQYGRENLMQVASVQTGAVEETQYTLTVEEELEAEEGEEPEIIEVELELTGYVVEAEWTYEEGSAVDTEELMKKASFIVADHDGRMEIISVQTGGEE